MYECLHFNDVQIHYTKYLLEAELLKQKFTFQKEFLDLPLMDNLAISGCVSSL
jgi:hypothetical protein